MKTLNDKEKLEMCIDFIRKISNMKTDVPQDFPQEDIDDHMTTIYIKPIKENPISNLAEEAWHILANIS